MIILPTNRKPKNLGVVFDSNYFCDEWKISQIEKSVSAFYENWNTQKFSEALKKFHIPPSKKVKELSKGMQMKLMIACAFSYDAKLLILDEATSRLDPVSRDELLNILSEYLEDGEHCYPVSVSTGRTGDITGGEICRKNSHACIQRHRRKSS